jgi:hypothetical protein
LAFISTLANGATSAGSGIWSNRSGSLELVVRNGVQAPSLPAGVVFADAFSQPPLLNDANQIAFIDDLSGAGVDATNQKSLWISGPSGLNLVARDGSSAPGLPGQVFKELSLPQLNAAGQIAFLAGVGPASDGGSSSIWATDRSGVLRLVVRAGDPLEVAPGDVRMIQDFDVMREIPGEHDGRPSYFNDLGQVAFLANFTDGSQGIFVSNAAAVPEPTAITLSIVVLLSCAFFRVQRSRNVR